MQVIKFFFYAFFQLSSLLLIGQYDEYQFIIPYREEVVMEIENNSGEPLIYSYNEDDNVTIPKGGTKKITTRAISDNFLINAIDFKIEENASSFNINFHKKRMALSNWFPAISKHTIYDFELNNFVIDNQSKIHQTIGCIRDSEGLALCPGERPFSIKCKDTNLRQLNLIVSLDLLNDQKFKTTIATLNGMLAYNYFDFHVKLTTSANSLPALYLNVTTDLPSSSSNCCSISSDNGYLGSNNVIDKIYIHPNYKYEAFAILHELGHFIGLEHVTDNTGKYLYPELNVKNIMNINTLYCGELGISISQIQNSWRCGR